MTAKDISNLEELQKSLLSSEYDVITKKNERDTESLYRFGWFYINGYKYSISAWSFQKKVITFESKGGTKVKYSIPNKLTFGPTNFKKDTYLTSIQKRLRNGLADFLKDLSDKLRT